MRGNIILEAHKIINGERQDKHGNPEDSLSIIAAMWNNYLNQADYLNPYDVCMLMALLKIGREMNRQNLDNLVDAVGYLGLAADMCEEKRC